MGKWLQDFPPIPLPSIIGRSLATSFCRMSLTMTSMISLWCGRALHILQCGAEAGFWCCHGLCWRQSSITFFVQSAGGGGKTYLCNTIAAAVRSKTKVALCVASSGIAALLLDGGRTAHSCFKIPISLHVTSSCNLKKNSDHKGLLKQTGIIIWDEAPMIHCYVMEALDRSLRDLLQNESPFGGITVLFGGDFHQSCLSFPRVQDSKLSVPPFVTLTSGRPPHSFTSSKICAKADHELYPQVWVPIPAGFYV